mmetsp:Transcript_13205/g.42319  ORF Transcript_13205/g.42319 Transcript_13205/m.42319 type:complete len:238 (-) Transcript_13205:3900-4613(-)
MNEHTRDLRAMLVAIQHRTNRPATARASSVGTPSGGRQATDAMPSHSSQPCTYRPRPSTPVGDGSSGSRSTPSGTPDDEVPRLSSSRRSYVSPSTASFRRLATRAMKARGPLESLSTIDPMTLIFRPVLSCLLPYIERSRWAQGPARLTCARVRAGCRTEGGWYGLGDPDSYPSPPLRAGNTARRIRQWRASVGRNMCSRLCGLPPPTASPTSHPRPHSLHTTHVATRREAEWLEAQ